MSGPRQRPAPIDWILRGGWWFPVHVLSLGMLSPVPFAQAAAVSRRLSHALAAVVYLLLVVGGIALVGTAPEDVSGSPEGAGADLGGVLIVAIWLGGIAHLVVLRQQLYGSGRRSAPARAGAPDGQVTDGSADRSDRAVTSVLAARTRREEARRIVASDPLLARELRIGRPDLSRSYDDGGLVDVATAPAEVIARVCGLTPAHAAEVVAAREAAGASLLAVDDLMAWADLPPRAWEHLRDRGIVLGVVGP